MTGDDLITAITEAATADDAIAIALRAPARARASAADLLYTETAGHDAAWVCAAIVREARA